MHPTVHIYVSFELGEYVVAPNSFTSDFRMFHNDQSFVDVLPSSPKKLGSQVISALSECRTIDIPKPRCGLFGMLAIDAFEVSKASTLDEFYASYYPLVVYKKDRRYWIGAGLSNKVNLQPVPIDCTCTHEALGRKIDEVKGLVEFHLGRDDSCPA